MTHSYDLSRVHMVGIGGSGTKQDVLRIAGVENASSVVVTPSTDDTAVLCTHGGHDLRLRVQLADR